MGTELALVSGSLEAKVPQHDLSLAQQLRSSWNVRLQTRWETTEGATCLQWVRADGEADAIGKALAFLAQENAKRPTPTRLAQALAVITAVCAKPADFDDAKVVLWSERLKRVMAEYPAAISLTAINEWPKSPNGKWWPTENELRELCEGLMAFRKALERALNFERDRMLMPVQSVKPFDDGFQPAPTGATAAYVAELKARDPRCAALYLDDARFTADRIGVRGSLARFTLERAAPGLLAKHGVRVVSPRAYSGFDNVEWEL